MIRQICKWIVFKIVYPCVYFVGSRRTIQKDKIIFVENHGEQISNDYLLLQDGFRQRKYDVRVHYLKVSSSAWADVIKRTIVMLWDMTTANCVFLNESNSVFGAFELRQETKLIQLWHACGAFKKWGNSVADKQFGDDKKDLERYSGHRNYSLVAVSGEAVCWAYEEAFGLQDKPSVVKAIGVSRTDVYFSENRREQAYVALGAFDQKMMKGTLAGRKIIVYAPTFRGDIKGAKSPDELDVGELAQLSEEYVLLVKQHPFVKEKFPVPKEYREFCVDVGETLSIEDLLIVADICVTDYSSIIFEYSLMRRPMLFFAYDIEKYYDERGFYYPYEGFVPGPIVRTTKELVCQIKNIETFDMTLVEAFCAKYMSGCDGHSTERMMRYVIES